MYFLPSPPSPRAFVIKARHKCIKASMGGCHSYNKVTLWAWPSVEVFHSPSLAKSKFTWPNCQNQAFMSSKPGRIHGSSKTFVRWQCAAFLKPCWHSQFASQTLATRTIRRLDFENRRSLISLLGLSMWSHYAEKGQISLNLAFSSPKWIDAQWQASQQLCSPFMYSLMWGSNPSPDSDKGPQMQVICRLT